MKRAVRLAVLMIATLFLLTGSVGAIESTSYSYTISVNGDWIHTQDTYIPGSIFLNNYDLNQPEDIFLYKDTVYIADGGNARIVVYNITTGDISHFQTEGMNTPTGLYADGGHIYIADFGAKKVFITEHDGTLLKTITRPDSPLFGKKSAYAPKKITADKNGNFYVASEGTYEGLIQFDKNGDFLGFYGYNKSKISLTEMVQDILFTREQKESLFNRIPNTMYNVTTDRAQGLILSITQLDKGNTIKKHNAAGNNILGGALRLIDEQNFVDIAASSRSMIYTVTETGLIYEYTEDGKLISSFGGRSVSSERNGQFTVAAAIDVDDNNNIYVLDKERGFFQVFYPTDYTLATHEALDSLKSGDYKHSRKLWEDLLRRNGLSVFAHYQLGNALFLSGEYEQAAEHFKIAREQDGYSEAFWEIRNDWMTRNLPAIMISIIALAALFITMHIIDRRKHFSAALKKKHAVFTQRHRLYGDLLAAVKLVRHPIDGYYDLKKGKKGSVAAATILLATAFVFFIINTVFAGFIFNPIVANEAPLLMFSIIFLVPVFLFIIGNYMVSSINNGEGTLRNVYIMTGYSLSFYILLMPVMFALSYMLTLNETVILTMLNTVTVGYTAVLFYLGIKEIHNYRVLEMIKNIFYTLFFMVMAIVVFAILHLLWGQVYQFVTGLFGEVSYRAGI